MVFLAGFAAGMPVHVTAEHIFAIKEQVVPSVATCHSLLNAILMATAYCKLPTWIWGMVYCFFGQTMPTTDNAIKPPGSLRFHPVHYVSFVSVELIVISITHSIMCKIYKPTLFRVNVRTATPTNRSSNTVFNEPVVSTFFEKMKTSRLHLLEQLVLNRSPPLVWPSGDD